MVETVRLSAAAVLRFEIKGWRSKVKERRLPAYRELADAGIMEPGPGSEFEYRFTAEGMKHREAILERESDRIERERYEPPDGNLSEPARELLRRHLEGDRGVNEENPPGLPRAGRGAGHGAASHLRRRPGVRLPAHVLGL
jgi:hypothetical protein